MLHLYVVGKFVCYTSWDLGPWWFKRAGLCWVKDHTATPGPPGWELDDGFMSHIMTESRQLFRDSSRKNEEATQVTILMTFTLWRQLRRGGARGFKQERVRGIGQVGGEV